MKTQILRDKKRRELVRRYEAKRVMLKYFLESTVEWDITPRMNLVFQLNKLPRNSSKVRIRNRCVMTGRGRGVYRKYKVSRIMLRHLASNGVIPGMRKSSW